MAETTTSGNGTLNAIKDDSAIAHAKGSPAAYGAPSRVTLHLEHLPRKNIKAPWPRTPSRVGIHTFSTKIFCLTSDVIYQVDPNNPPWPAYRGYHEYSFAHATMGVRLPTILGKAIDDTSRTLNEQSDEDKIVDLVQCLERMDLLMVDLSGNAKLRPIIDDGEGDVALWNKEIAKYFQGMMFVIVKCIFILPFTLVGKDFMNAPWLFAEAYKYRRLHECFSVGRYWKDYDVFYRQKV
jgi:hypothetical protein